MSAFLEACLQLKFILPPLRLLQTLIRCLRQRELGICVHNAHVMNNVSPILPDVTDQEVTLLLHGL